MFCKNCGAEHDKGVAVCTKCGFAIGTGEHYCPTCGVAIEPGQAVCVSCGTALNAAGNQLGKSTKSKVVAGLLGILLVTVLTCGIGGTAMGIWALVEGIFILIGHEGYTTDAEGRTLSE